MRNNFLRSPCHPGGAIRSDKLPALHHDFHARLKGGSVRLSSLVDSLFESPVMLVTRVKQRFNVTYPTAKSDLEKLTALGIVERLIEMQQMTYFCRAICRVTYEEV